MMAARIDPGAFSLLEMQRSQARTCEFRMMCRQFVAHIVSEPPGPWVAHVLEESDGELRGRGWVLLECPADASDEQLCAALAEQVVRRLGA